MSNYDTNPINSVGSHINSTVNLDKVDYAIRENAPVQGLPSIRFILNDEEEIQWFFNTPEERDAAWKGVFP